MPRTDNEVRIIPSVLDRLIDYEPEMSHEALASRSKSLRQLKQSVKRDLEWLLNTRYVPEEIPSDLKEVHNSVAAYGLPDFSNASVKNPADRKRLRSAIEAAVRNFEPRLKDVSVTIESAHEGEHALHFRIDARLMVEPTPEPITFDTMLQLESGSYIIREE